MTDLLANAVPVDVEKPEEDDQTFWSVTTIIKAATSNEALVWWSAQETAKAAVRAAGSLKTRIEEEGEEAVVDWLSKSRFRRPRGERGAAELGTAFHAWAEQYVLTGERPPCDDELRPYADQFDGWATKFQPEYTAAELTVYSPRYGYAGTADAFLKIQGMHLIADIKTSKKSFNDKGQPTTPYPEVGAQLAMYRFAEMAATWRPRRYEKFRRRYYCLGTEERELAVPVPAVEGGLAIHVTPGHCNAHVIRCDEAVFQQCLYLIEAARWKLEMEKTIVGEPLVFEEAS